jgi:opacity protein-like surface antigen
MKIIKFVRRALIVPALVFTQCAVAADGAFPALDEVRAGVMANADSGQSINGDVQVLFAPYPFTAKAFEPQWAWLFSPRPLIGASISLQGKTSEAYAGLAWTLPISGPFFAELSAGGLIHDQTLNQNYSDRPSPLTTRLLFRESIAIGYQIDPNWRILAFADHGSDGNLGYRNVAVNHFGILVGNKFGPSSSKLVTADTALSTFNWSGPYAGFGVGLAHSQVDFKMPIASTSAANSVNLAAQAGYNLVFGPVVMGGELDYAIQALEGTTNVNAADAALSISSFWLVTARGRLGTEVEIPYLSKRSLIYGTGGLAVSRIANGYCLHASVQCYTGPNRDIGSGWSADGTIRTGWTAGAGVEIPLAPMVTGKIEYLYVDFGNIQFNNAAINDEVTFRQHILRTGMNFKLN